MDSNNDETESNSSCHGQKTLHDQQSDRIKKLEDNFGLMFNYVKRNNRRIHSLLSKVTPDSELLSGLLMEENLLGTDGDITSFDSVAKDSNFLDKCTAQKQADDNYKKLEMSLEDLHQENKKKDKQLKGMREVLDRIQEKEFLNLDVETTREIDTFICSDAEVTKRTEFLMLNEKELEHHHLPMDTYSYLAVADYFTGGFPTYAFCMAMFVLSVQVVTLLIFAADVTNLSDGDNRLSIPAGVSTQVRASQFVALIISCWNQGEISDSFNMFSLGYNEGRARAINPHATRVKWYFSAVLRTAIGLLSLLVTFALVVNSETVKDVMLDFAAVTFVSELDHANFRLSLWGYMGKTVQKLAVQIKTTSIFDGKPTARLMKVPRLAWMLIIFGSFMVPWIEITLKQERGEFMDQTIFVQFGDGFSPSIGAFSGLYTIDLDNSLDGIRVNYIEHQRQSATFSYCSQDSTWIFQYGPNPDNVDHYGCWSRARSSQTENLDIARTSQDTWFVMDEHMMREMPLQHMYISGRRNYNGRDCESNRDCGEDWMYCEEDIGECVCTDGLFGTNCEFTQPCQTLEIDTRDPNGGFYGTRIWSSRYSSVQEDGKKDPLQVYGKPVYVGDVWTEGLVDVIFFTGRRWILTDSGSIEDYNQTSTMMGNSDIARDFVEYIANDFHAYWSKYTFYFASEPVDVGTPTDSATPIGLQWYRMETSGTQGVSLRSGERIWQSATSIEANLFCALCNNATNPCFFYATCRSDGSCDCSTGSTGRLCQVPPSGNGFCDLYFNNPEFDWDGGDCCEETCTSTEENTCGQGMIEISAGVDAILFVGYPNCLHPRYSSKVSGSITLYDVIERGSVRCGSQQFSGFLNVADGVYTGFEADLCRAIAAAALGDPEAIEIIETTSRFSDLSEGKFDVLLSAATFTAERDIYQSDSRSGFSFVPTPYFFDGLHYGGIPPFNECADKIAENRNFESPECSNLAICVVAPSSWLIVTGRLFPDQAIVRVENRQDAINGLQSGACNVIAGEVTFAAESVVRRMGFTGPVYELGNSVVSKEPLAAVTRQDDRVWSKFVSWIFEALVQAEESDVTRLTANKLSTSDVFGEQFQNMFQNAVAANGNYGEIYRKNLGGEFPRDGLNRINIGESGLIYSFPFGVYENMGPGPIPGGSIEGIQRRGVLNCGVMQAPGFAAQDSNSWRGFDVDICEGIAAALLSGYPRVNVISLRQNDRFRALAEGAVDVICRSTHNLAREVMESTAREGFDFTPAYFYDGLGFGGHSTFLHCAESMALGLSEFTSKCNDTRICVPTGSSWLEAMRNQLNIPAENIHETESVDRNYEEFNLGNCNVITGESAQIAESTVRERGYNASEDYVISRRKFTKSPLSVMSRSTDAQFSDFLRWIVFGFFFAAEEGFTSENYLEMPTTLLFGNSLYRMWQNAIQAVGNYNEMIERNFAGVMEVGGQNTLNNKNGPQFFAKPGVMIN